MGGFNFSTCRGGMKHKNLMIFLKEYPYMRDIHSRNSGNKSNDITIQNSVFTISDFLFGNIKKIVLPKPYFR